MLVGFPPQVQSFVNSTLVFQVIFIKQIIRKILIMLNNVEIDIGKKIWKLS